MVVFYRIPVGAKTARGQSIMVKIAMRTQRGYSSQTSIGITHHTSASTADKRIRRVEKSLYSYLKTSNFSKTWRPPKR